MGAAVAASPFRIQPGNAIRRRFSSGLRSGLNLDHNEFRAGLAAYIPAMAAWNCYRGSDRRPASCSVALSEFAHYVRDLLCWNPRLGPTKAMVASSCDSFRGSDCRVISASLRLDYAERLRAPGSAERTQNYFR